jgi:hypothetical protein
MSDLNVVEAARGWLGTRFHHQGRLKRTASHRGGVDCLGLLVGVAKELALKGPNGRFLFEFDTTNYSHQPDVNQLKQRLSELLVPKHSSATQPSDILLVHIDHSPQHLAIASELNGVPAMIHAYAPAKAVVEHVLDDWWRSRIDCIFAIHPQ